ncbi:uncharacterized protein LOC123559868 [Mercenaria mercenaria]|uniref:uncharacterized protein LOC123559868 n=1 Tax=Mercenaria mercenaria TaxID=6596 RepID=UPI00234EB19D|nr:uncharacterized protein LOC123559868 [Mercenaria mercenaria]
MEYLSKYCVCLLVLLAANASEARHLTEKQSDAATRISKSLTEPRVTFLKTSNNDSTKTKTSNANSATSQHIAATKVKTHVSVHTRPSDSETNRDAVDDEGHAPLGALPLHRHSFDNQNIQLKGKRISSISNSRDEKVNTDYHDNTEDPGPNDITEDKNIGKVYVRPESTKHTGEELHQSHRRIDVHEANSIDHINENGILKNNAVSRGSDTTSIQNESDGVVNHISSNIMETSALTHLGIKNKQEPFKKNLENRVDDLKHDLPQTVTLSDSRDKPDVGDQPTGKGSYSQDMPNPDAKNIRNWNVDSNTVHSESSHKDIRNPGMTQTIQPKTNDIDRRTENWRTKEAKTQGSNLKSVSKDGDTVLRNNHVNTVVHGGDSTKLLRPKITVFIEEKNDREHTQRVIASNGNGVIQSRPIHVSDTSLNTGGSRALSSDTGDNKVVSSNAIGTKSEHMDENEGKTDLSQQASAENDPSIDAVQNSDLITPPMAVLENTHDNKMQSKHTIEPAETNTNNLHNVGSKGEATLDSVPAIDGPEKRSDKSDTMKPSAIPATEKTTTTDNNEAIDIPSTVITNTVRKPEDVSPLDIFTSDITYQRFPQPMSLTTFKKKVLGKRLKKLYILEQSEKKLFQHVRQLEAIYTIEDGTLYVSFLFRFVYSRKCQEIPKFRMGKLVGNTDIAMFEKEMKDGKTERILFFSERPEDYVFFMSCTDMKTSPYACRDSYYLTLDSAHDPPNQFPWADAAREMESKLDLTFEDPRFIFNFVLLPCARKTAS